MDALFEIGVERPASLSMSIAQVRETLPAGGGGWVGRGEARVIVDVDRTGA